MSKLEIVSPFLELHWFSPLLRLGVVLVTLGVVPGNDLGCTLLYTLAIRAWESWGRVGDTPGGLLPADISWDVYCFII